MGIRPDIGLLYDDIFLALTHASPSIPWYTHLLGLRDSLYAHWIANPKTHTRCCTTIIIILCNALAIVEIRLFVA